MRYVVAEPTGPKTEVVVGTIDVEEDVYLNDTALLTVLVEAGYLIEADELVIEDGDHEDELYVWHYGTDTLMLIINPE